MSASCQTRKNRVKLKSKLLPFLNGLKTGRVWKPGSLEKKRCIRAMREDLKKLSETGKWT